MRTVLLDVDGVSADFVQHTLNTLVRLRGPRLSPENILTWDIFSSLPPSCEDALLAEWHRAGWCATMPLYAGAREGIARLNTVARVVYVTTPMHDAPHWMWERDQWLRNHLNASGRDIIFAAAKHLVMGDVFVDDKVSNVLEWHQHHPEGVAILWERPYNRHEDIPQGVIRTNSWDVVFQHVS